MEWKSSNRQEHSVFFRRDDGPFVILIFLESQFCPVTDGNNPLLGAFSKTTQETLSKKKVAGTQTA